MKRGERSRAGFGGRACDLGLGHGRIRTLPAAPKKRSPEPRGQSRELARVSVPPSRSPSATPRPTNQSPPAIAFLPSSWTRGARRRARRTRRRRAILSAKTTVPGSALSVREVGHARRVDLQRLAASGRERARPRRHPAHVIVDGARRLREVDAPVFLLQHRRHRRLRVVLLRWACSRRPRTWAGPCASRARRSPRGAPRARRPSRRR